ncbi:MAG: DUF1993 family protein [Stappiaceae bacterium]
MSTDLAESVPLTIHHYLGRTAHLLNLLCKEQEPDQLLGIKLAPDMLDTGLNFAIAIGFAARALCPPAGLQAPDIPDEITCTTLQDYQRDIAALIKPIRATDLKAPVSHTAGEAELIQDPAEYVTQFALPNMIFHLSMGYAGLRYGGMKIGKADFDGFHAYA